MPRLFEHPEHTGEFHHGSRTSQERGGYEHLRGQVRRAHPATPAQGKTLGGRTGREVRNCQTDVVCLGIRGIFTSHRPATISCARYWCENRETISRRIENFFPCLFRRNINKFLCLRNSIKVSVELFSTILQNSAFSILQKSANDVIIPIQDLSDAIKSDARKPLSGLASQKFQRRKRPDRQPLNLTSGGSWPVFLC